MAGGPLGLVGHGTRERTLLGPLGPDGQPEELDLLLQRYRCRGCGAVVVSAPRGVLRGMVYGAAAIALALALWASEGIAGWRVRERVAARPSSGDERWHGWRSLRRWASSAARWWTWLRHGAGDGRQRALSVVTQLAARAATPTGAVLALACEGALRS